MDNAAPRQSAHRLAYRIMLAAEEFAEAYAGSARSDATAADTEARVLARLALQALVNEVCHGQYQSEVK